MAPRRKKGRTYTEEDLQAAIEAVKDGMSYRNAESEFGVPRATIKDHVSELHVGHVGHPTELCQEEEIMIRDSNVNSSGYSTIKSTIFKENVKFNNSY